MCVFLGRARKFFWPQSGGGAIAPLAPPVDPPLQVSHNSQLYERVLTLICRADRCQSDHTRCLRMAMSGGVAICYPSIGSASGTELSGLLARTLRGLGTFRSNVTSFYVSADVSGGPKSVSCSSRCMVGQTRPLP